MLTEQERTALVGEVETIIKIPAGSDSREQAEQIVELLAAHDLDAIAHEFGTIVVSDYGDEGYHAEAWRPGPWTGQRNNQAVGPTRMAAIRNAVAQAQGRGGQGGEQESKDQG